MHNIPALDVWGREWRSGRETGWRRERHDSMRGMLGVASEASGASLAC